MRKSDCVVVTLAVVVICYFLLGIDTDSGTRLVGLAVIAGTAFAAMTFLHIIDRSPKLVVEYRNPGLGDRPELVRGQRASFLVVVRNEGRGPARAVEVSFDTFRNGWLFNESGNQPNPMYLDYTVRPPRFTGLSRVLGPNEEWNIAKVSSRHPPTTLPEPAAWEARAEGMKTQSGVIEFSWATDD